MFRGENTPTAAPTFTAANTARSAMGKPLKIADRRHQKALSGLGFSGDIFMGLYDNLDIPPERTKLKFDLKNASETAGMPARFRRGSTTNFRVAANTLAAGVLWPTEVNKVLLSPGAGDTPQERRIKERHSALPPP